MGSASGLVYLLAGVLLLNSGVCEEQKSAAVSAENELKFLKQIHSKWDELKKRRKTIIFELVLASNAAKFPSNLQFIFFFPSTHSAKKRKKKIDVFFLLFHFQLDMRKLSDAVLFLVCLVWSVNLVVKIMKKKSVWEVIDHDWWRIGGQIEEKTVNK